MGESRASQLYPKISEDHYDLPTHLEGEESAVGEVQVLSKFVPSQKHLNPSIRKNIKNTQVMILLQKQKAKKSKAPKYQNNVRQHLVKIVSGSRFVRQKILLSVV